MGTDMSTELPFIHDTTVCSWLELTGLYLKFVLYPVEYFSIGHSMSIKYLSHVNTTQGGLVLTQCFCNTLPFPSFWYGAMLYFISLTCCKYS